MNDLIFVIMLISCCLSLAQDVDKCDPTEDFVEDFDDEKLIYFRKRCLNETDLPAIKKINDSNDYYAVAKTTKCFETPYLCFETDFEVNIRYTLDETKFVNYVSIKIIRNDQMVDEIELEKGNYLNKTISINVMEAGLFKIQVGAESVVLKDYFFIDYISVQSSQIPTTTETTDSTAITDSTTIIDSTTTTDSATTTESETTTNSNHPWEDSEIKNVIETWGSLSLTSLIISAVCFLCLIIFFITFIFKMGGMKQFLEQTIRIHSLKTSSKSMTIPRL